MVEISVDMQRRESLRRLHTATHIINFCAKKILGNHVWQNGSNLKPDMGSLDITHYQHISREEIIEIEKLANQTVFENKSVSIEEIDRTEAEKKYGFELYQGGAIPMKTLRIINVLDSDTEACGGIHMHETGGIGLIKIVDSQKIQDGVIRLSYVVHNYALEYLQKQETLLDSTSKVFSVQKEHVEKTAQKFFDEWKEQKKEIEKLKTSLKDTFKDQVLNSNQKEFYTPLNEMPALIEVITQALAKGKSSCKLQSDNFIVATQDIEVPTYKKKLEKGNFNVYIL